MTYAPFQMHHSKTGWVITLDGWAVSEPFPDQVTAFRVLTALRADGRRHPSVVGRILRDTLTSPF